MVEAYGQEDRWDTDDWGDDGGEDDYTDIMEETAMEKKTSTGLDEEKVFLAGHIKNKYYTIIDSNEIHIEQ